MHHWPNENTKWPTLEDLLLHFGVTWFSPSIETLYDWPIIVDCIAQLACNFWASLALNENSYQKPWPSYVAISDVKEYRDSKGQDKLVWQQISTLDVQHVAIACEREY